METKQELKRENFKERYNFKCCSCNHEQSAAPSIMMTGFGMNQGHGSCLKCGQFLHLEIEGGLDGDNMVSKLWDDYLKEQGIEIPPKN